MENINQIKNDATKAFDAVVEFREKELGIEKGNDAALFDMYGEIEIFLSELRIKDPSKAQQLAKKYEALKDEVDKTFKNIAKHTNEIYE